MMESFNVYMVLYVSLLLLLLLLVVLAYLSLFFNCYCVLPPPSTELCRNDLRIRSEAVANLS